MRKIKNNRLNDVAELPISDCLKSSYNWPLPFTDLIIGTALYSTYNNKHIVHFKQVDVPSMLNLFSSSTYLCSLK